MAQTQYGGIDIVSAGSCNGSLLDGTEPLPGPMLSFMYHPYGPATIIQYIPRNMHTVFALLCFVVVIHWLIFPYPSGFLHWHCGNLTIAPVPAKQPWWILINTSCEFIMNDCITTTKQSTTKPCAYFLGYTVRGQLENYISQISFKSFRASGLPVYYHHALAPRAGIPIDSYLWGS